MKKTYNRLIRAFLVLIGNKNKFYTAKSSNGFILYYDYINDSNIVYLKDVALYFGFNSLEEALKSDTFQLTLINRGIDFNQLTYEYHE